MWELYKDVLWLVVLCIAGIAACLTGIGCLVFYHRKELFAKKVVRQFQQQTDGQTTQTRKRQRENEVFVIDLDD